SSCCRVGRRRPTASIMLVSKRQQRETESPRLRGPMRSIVSALIAAVLLCGTSARISADALDGALEVVSAHVELDHSVYQLHARIEYPNTPAIRAALADGVTLAFDVEARITRDRHLWIDPVVDDATLRRELTYHTVSDRYV